MSLFPAGFLGLSVCLLLDSSLLPVEIGGLAATEAVGGELGLVGKGSVSNQSIPGGAMGREPTDLERGESLSNPNISSSS